MQSFVLEQQYDNLGGKPVTAEVVSWEVGKVHSMKFVERSINTHGVCERKHEQ